MVGEVVEGGAVEVVARKGVGSYIFDFYLSSLNWGDLAFNTVIFERISSQRP